jgi:D-mannonate dehydratase
VLLTLTSRERLKGATSYVLDQTLDTGLIARWRKHGLIHTEPTVLPSTHVLDDFRFDLLLGQIQREDRVLPSDQQSLHIELGQLQKISLGRKRSAVYFLERVIPEAERQGIALAMHLDDPPLDEFMGRAWIINSVEGFERLVEIVPGRGNGICFCQGTFAQIGVDIPATILRLGPHIRYVHCRDVRGQRDCFVETFRDNGPTDMVAAIRAYKEIGFAGSIRPDHVPQLEGKDDGGRVTRCWAGCSPMATCVA